jgi:hypothetical protein
MAQRLNVLAILGNAIVDTTFRDELLAPGNLVPTSTKTGLTLTQDDTTELQNLQDVLQDSGLAARLRTALAQIGARSNCPMRPCGRSLPNGGYKVLALLGDACVDAVFRQQFLAQALTTAQQFLEDPPTGQDVTELNGFDGLARATRDAMAPLMEDARDVLARCPQGPCVKKL